MAKWGSFEIDELERLAKTFKKALDERVIERFIREFLLEMAVQTMQKIKMRTPVDSGELRRNWVVGRVERRGNAFVVEIFNNTDYASFVEFGHLTGDDLTQWQEGHFMMTLSMKEIEERLPGHLEKKQMQLLDNLINGRKG